MLGKRGEGLRNSRAAANVTRGDHGDGKRDARRLDVV
jgi:hypothetical protein